MEGKAGINLWELGLDNGFLKDAKPQATKENLR